MFNLLYSLTEYPRLTSIHSIKVCFLYFFSIYLFSSNWIFNGPRRLILNRFERSWFLSRIFNECNRYYFVSGTKAPGIKKGSQWPDCRRRGKTPCAKTGRYYLFRYMGKQALSGAWFLLAPLQNWALFPPHCPSLFFLSELDTRSIAD